jgi:YggT family protein
MLAFIFLIETAFDCFITLLIVRLLVQKMQMSDYNPIFRLIKKITDPVVLPTRRIVPKLRGIDMAIVAWILILGVVKSVLIFRLQWALFPHVIGLSMVTMGQIATQWFDIYFFAILIRIMMSWISPLQRGPFAEVVFLIAEPVLHPFRRFVPSWGGIDFSPMAALLAMKLITILLFAPAIAWGMRAAVS